MTTEQAYAGIFSSKALLSFVFMLMNAKFHVSRISPRARGHNKGVNSLIGT